VILATSRCSKFVVGWCLESINLELKADHVEKFNGEAGRFSSAGLAQMVSCPKETDVATLVVKKMVWPLQDLRYKR